MHADIPQFLLGHEGRDTGPMEENRAHDLQDVDREGPQDEPLSAVESTACLLASAAGVVPSSRVLEIGGGQASMLTYLADRFGCCGESLYSAPPPDGFFHKVADRRHRIDVAFRYGSAARLPYGPRAFTHVVAQDSLHRMSDQRRCLTEIHRVLDLGGTLACAEPLRPRDGGSLTGYRRVFREAGFDVLEARDLSTRMRQTLKDTAEAARNRAERFPDSPGRHMMLDYAMSREELCRAIDRGEFGWAAFICRKRER